MSVTVSQQPQDYMLAFNPIWFTALSNQIAQDNFMYRVVCTDMATSESQTYEIPQRPDGYCVFNAGTFVKSYFPNNRTTHELPMNEYGWKLCTGIRQFRVNIGEFYGSTPSYASGTNIDFLAWNGVADYLDFYQYDQADYVFNGPAGSLKYLTSLHRDYTYEDRGHMLFALTGNTNEVQSIRIDAYDANGTFLWDSFIANPYSLVSGYSNRYFCIDVGHKGLKNINPVLVTGTYPIITNQVAYYVINDGSVLSGAGTTTEIKRIDIRCEPRYDVFTIHYLKKNGSFQTIHFSKKSESERSKETTYYKQNPYAIVSGEYLYQGYDALEKPLSIISQERLKLNTDWMTPEEVEAHKDIIDSPIVYLDRGLSVPYPALKVVTGTYKVNKLYNERLFSIQMDFEYSHQNTRQT